MFGKINSEWGSMVTSIDDEGFIEGLWFDQQKYFPDLSNVCWIDENTDDVIMKAYSELQQQLLEYQIGSRKVFDLKLKPKGTSFRNKVWKILNEIEYGTTTTYKKVGLDLIAKTKQSSMSAQAIGGAVGHNPISIIIPCHRVIASDGRLTGYAGGLTIKEKLLKHEQKHT